MKISENKSKIFGSYPVIVMIIVIAASLFFLSAQLSALLYKQSSGIKMNHKLHAENGAECTQCHKQSTENTRFMGFAGHEVCKECHDEEVENESKCQTCHTNADKSTNLRKNTNLSPLVNFDHKQHADGGINCVQCHVNTPASKSVSGNNQLPEMEVCVACHKEQGISDTKDCTTCHIEGFEKIRPADHTPLWYKNHGKDLEQSKIDYSCKTCHTKKNGNDCIDCHRKEKPKDHTISWRIRGHAQKAQLDRESCATCHNQSECVTCHKTEEPFSHTGFWGAPRYRHCVNCHIEGDNYAGGGIAGNCTFCHSKSIVSAKHRSNLYPDHNRSWNCLSCHRMTGSTGGAPNISHPFPPDITSCRSCH